jgi:oxygen-independent coproporphyrinogen-3 oxidase
VTASLYIHVPFCVSKCAYCDFYSAAAARGDPAVVRYAERALEEIAEKVTRYEVKEVPSVYVGGGTPSILGSEGIARLLSFVTAGTGMSVLPDAEITVEANPDTMDEPFLTACRKHGVTRISLGVQTFNDVCRNSVNRVGSGTMVKEKLALLGEAFPGAFSADLMSGLPGQDERILMADIETLLNYHPAHISLYDLIPHGTLSGGRGLLPEDRKAALWIRGRDALLEAGYEQYEVSNFALSAHARSAHNIRYWLMQNWIGAGPSASGTVIDDDAGAGIRETDGHIERLDADALIKETFLMGFRYCEGPDAALVERRFHRSIEDTIPASLAKWTKRGIIRKGTLKPERDGLLFLDGFLRDCFTEVTDQRPINPR